MTDTTMISSSGATTPKKSQSGYFGSLSGGDTLPLRILLPENTSQFELHRAASGVKSTAIRARKEDTLLDVLNVVCSKVHRGFFVNKHQFVHPSKPKVDGQFQSIPLSAKVQDLDTDEIMLILSASRCGRVSLTWQNRSLTCLPRRRRRSGRMTGRANS